MDSLAMSLTKVALFFTLNLISIIEFDQFIND
jgi:hypothetical protein